MGVLKEFKEFAVKGNMVDMAVGIIIGGAFGKVVSSIVSDLLMPPLGYLIGGINFTDIKIPLKVPALGGNAAQVAAINIGSFLQSLVDFAIIAFAVFLMVQAINRLHRKEEQAPVPPPAPTRQEELLAEIRDLLRQK